MNRLFTFVRDRHALLYKAFLFVVSLGLIIYLYPREFRFRYELNDIVGKPWTHDNLIAPFGFAVQKTPEEIAEEQADLKKNFIPYFRLDDRVATQHFEDISFQIFSTSEKTKADRIRRIMADIYKSGVRGVRNPAGKGPEDPVLLVKDNVAEEHRLGEFADVIEADSLLLSLITQEERKVWDEKFSTFRANILFDSVLTNRELSQQLGTKGQIIVSRGQLVNDEIYQELLSLQEAYNLQYQSGGGWAVLAGQIILVAFCLFSLFQFLRLFRRDILGNDARLLFILLMVVLNVCMSFIPSVIETVPILALPFCILPVIMRAFFDTRLALFVHLIAIMIISVCLPGDRFAFLFIQFLAGITAIFSIVNMRNRAQLFVSVVAILGTYALLHFCLVTVTEAEMAAVRPADFINYTVSAFLVLLAYPLIFLFEKIFGFVSDVTLMELADSNNPLLRELSEKAPGTFQHSMQVGNLAEEAIRVIGGNTLLVRAGALYHDIGKGDMPLYFIENQAAGVNPHEELTFEESASIIIRHVIRGIEKAKEAKLPDQVIDFIRTHHGTTNTAYFLTLYKKNNPEDFIDEELFRYPGPIPYSKETAVLMMADAVEASSRSLKKYDAESIDELVERIIDHQADQHQFDNSDVTLKDITAIKKIFKKKLRSIYHVRVEYPA
jgi:putative nucleotidyltransferase with HDIG domain